MEYPSASSVWHTHEQNILNASYFPEYVADKSIFQNWVNDIFEFHHESKLRKTGVNHPNPNTVRKILEIIDRRLKHLDDDTDDTIDVEPLRILVMGGSVTQGINSEDNPLGLNLKRDSPWPVRLENMFNEGIFGGRKVVEVTNMAAGGSSSEIGALVVKYQIFPNNEIPHIIIAAFTPNDHQQPDIEKVFYEEIQDFVQNAINVCPCNKDLPLVVLADHMYRPSGRSRWDEQLRLSGYNAVLAAWYDVMAFNHGNLGLHHVMANFDNKTKIEQLVGGDFSLHLGTGFHIGLAWTALFNFIEAFVDNCNDLEMQSTPAANSTRSDVPSVSSRIDDLLASPSAKHLSKLSNQESIVDSLNRWKQRTEEARTRCSSMTASNNTATACTGENKVCSHAWIVGKGTGVNYPQELSRVLDPVLKSNDGWVVKGRPVRNPRVGLYAEKENATFTMKFPIMENPINILTIFSMKSYGPDWIGSKMEIRMTIDHGVGNTTAPDVATHEIDGFHEIKTSVHFPHKFELPGNGASVGDTLILEAKLVGGSAFKIHGIALCRF